MRFDASFEEQPDDVDVASSFWANVQAHNDPETAEAIRSSRALSADITVPAPPGFSFLPFQLAGIKYMLDHKNTLLADEMGTGKSPQSIGVVNADPLAHRVLIVCPAFLKENWQKEFSRWSVKDLSIGVVRTGRTANKKQVKFPETDVVITNYELLSSWREEIRKVFWDVAIFDEVHYLKNNKADRTKEVFGCRAFKEQERIEPIRSRRMLLLTGTPLPNKTRELWPIIHALDPSGLGKNRMNFEKRYCGGAWTPIIPKSRLTFHGVPIAPPADTSKFKHVWQANGSTNAEELQMLMRSKFMVRRLRADVLPMLPKKRRQVILIEAEGTKNLLEKERKIYEEYGKDLEDLDLDTPEFSKISLVRKEIGIKKIPFIIDRIREALNETQKVVCFVHHHEVIDKIREAFIANCVVVDGRIPNDERQVAVDDFQNTSSDCRLFLGTLGAAGVGFTLTSSWLAIFGESSWRPSDVTQGEDRLCRIGQTQGVLVQHIVLKDSLDERQIQLMISKQEIADTTLDKI
jgi:SNF2 family DNA or RNA helicase